MPAPCSQHGTVAASGWRLVELLAAGGTADVWFAVDSTGREAALKIPRFTPRHRIAASRLLQREYRSLRALEHPFVVRTVGLHALGMTPALALELLPGGDLVSLLGSHPRHWLMALRDVLAALVYLHARGFAHGDIKARNILFAADGTPRLIDFASVRRIEASAVARAGSTAAYRPAEFAGSGREADQFAFATLLYELLTGRLPYGVDGARRRGELPSSWQEPDVAAAGLMSVAAATLAAGGSAAGGLSAFADVIESAATAYF